MLPAQVHTVRSASAVSTPTGKAKPAHAANGQTPSPSSSRESPDEKRTVRQPPTLARKLPTGAGHSAANSLELTPPVTIEVRSDCKFLQSHYCIVKSTSSPVGPHQSRGKDVSIRSRHMPVSALDEDALSHTVPATLRQSTAKSSSSFRSASSSPTSCPSELAGKGHCMTVTSLLNEFDKAHESERIENTHTPARTQLSQSPKGAVGSSQLGSGANSELPSSPDSAIRRLQDSAARSLSSLSVEPSDLSRRRGARRSEWSCPSVARSPTVVVARSSPSTPIFDPSYALFRPVAHMEEHAPRSASSPARSSHSGRRVRLSSQQHSNARTPKSEAITPIKGLFGPPQSSHTRLFGGPSTPSGDDASQAAQNSSSETGTQVFYSPLMAAQMGGFGERVSSRTTPQPAPCSEPTDTATDEFGWDVSVIDELTPAKPPHFLCERGLSPVANADGAQVSFETSLVEPPSGAKPCWVEKQDPNLDPLHDSQEAQKDPQTPKDRIVPSSRCTPSVGALGHTPVALGHSVSPRFDFVQVETPQKSMRRPATRPSQTPTSFALKAMNASLEAQSQLNTSITSAAVTPGHASLPLWRDTSFEDAHHHHRDHNSSNQQQLPLSTATVSSGAVEQASVLLDDYLPPSRNPFSSYRQHSRRLADEATQLPVSTTVAVYEQVFQQAGHSCATHAALLVNSGSKDTSRRPHARPPMSANHSTRVEFPPSDAMEESFDQNTRRQAPSYTMETPPSALSPPHSASNKSYLSPSWSHPSANTNGAGESTARKLSTDDGGYSPATTVSPSPKANVSPLEQLSSALKGSSAGRDTNERLPAEGYGISLSPPANRRAGLWGGQSATASSVPRRGESTRRSAISDACLTPKRKLFGRDSTSSDDEEELAGGSARRGTNAPGKALTSEEQTATVTAAQGDENLLEGRLQRLSASSDNFLATQTGSPECSGHPASFLCRVLSADGESMPPESLQRLPSSLNSSPLISPTTSSRHFTDPQWSATAPYSGVVTAATAATEQLKPFSKAFADLPAPVRKSSGVESTTAQQQNDRKGGGLFRSGLSLPPQIPRQNGASMSLSLSSPHVHSQPPSESTFFDQLHAMRHTSARSESKLRSASTSSRGGLELAARSLSSAPWSTSGHAAQRCMPAHASLASVPQLALFADPRNLGDRSSSLQEASCRSSMADLAAAGSSRDNCFPIGEEVEEEPGDRFLQHHPFQFAHYVPCVSKAAFFVPLSVDANGIVWMATHRVDGLPYAVKEIPLTPQTQKQLTVELECLTLAGDVSSRFQRQAEAFLVRYCTCTSLPIAVSSMQVLSAQTSGGNLVPTPQPAVLLSPSEPASTAAPTTVALLQTEHFPLGSVWDCAFAGTRLGHPGSLPFSWETVLTQGLMALEALHSQQLVHGCPLPFHLFVFAQDHIKLGQFGSASKCPTSYIHRLLPACVHPPHWADPYRADVRVLCSGLLVLLVLLAESRDEHALHDLQTLSQDSLHKRLSQSKQVLQQRFGCSPQLLNVLQESQRGLFSAAQLLEKMGAPSLNELEICWACNAEIAALEDKVRALHADKETGSYTTDALGERHGSSVRRRDPSHLLTEYLRSEFGRPTGDLVDASFEVGDVHPESRSGSLVNTAVDSAVFCGVLQQRALVTASLFGLSSAHPGATLSRPLTSWETL